MTSIYSPGYHIYFDSPTPIFKARVNMATVTYPVTALVFDTVTLGAFGDLIPDMTLALGSSEGAWDLGLVRVHNFATSTTIPVGRISRGRERGSLDVSDNMYITVFNDYRVWSKIPRMIIDPDDEETDITTYKDANIPILSYNDEIPPTANSGPFFADYIDDTTDLITVTFPMNGVAISYANAEGATITGYQWDIEDGTLTAGTLTSSSITATFPAGKRWVGLTVTDSNGKVHTTRSFVLAIDPAADLTYKDWASANFSLKQSGQTVDIVLNANLPRSTYPDGALVLIWKDAPASAGDRSHMKFVGWQENEDWNVASSRRGMARGTTIHCVDIANKMALLPGFPQALERSDEVAWEYMPDLTMNRVLNYLGAWHTTAWSLADIILPADADYPIMRRDTGADSIFDQMDANAKLMVPGYPLTCTPEGQLIFQKDWMEDDVGDRPAAALVIQELDIADLQVSLNPQPRAHSLHKGAIKTSTDWIYIGGKKDVPLVFSIAPGDAFSQGREEVVESQGIAKSQSDLNKVTGHRYARKNSKYAPFRISFASQPDYWEFAPAYMQRVQLNLTAAYASQRGLEFSSEEGMVMDASIRLTNSRRGMTSSFTLTWELETFGPAGQTHIPEESDEPDYSPPEPVPTEPPGIGDGESMIAAIGIDGYIYRTSNFQATSPTWDRVDTGIADTIYSWVVDPFSPKYISGSGKVNGWIVNDIGIYRVEDIFGTPDAFDVYLFDVATVPGDFNWRQISASFGAFFGSGFNPWLMCVSYYGDNVAKLGTTAVYSTDAGAIWSEEVWVSDDYISTNPPRFNPIALWMSPRSPGLAYTVAYRAGSGEPIIRFGTKTNGGAFVNQGLSASYATTSEAIAPPTTTNEILVFIGPPADTKRMVVEGVYSASLSREGPSGGAGGGNIQLGDPISVARTDNLAWVAPTFGSPVFGTWEAEYTFTGGDWPGNRDSMLTSPPTGSSNGVLVEVDATAQSTGAAGVVTNTVSVTLRVTEIELDDGTIIHPSDAQVEAYITGDWGETWVAPENLAIPGSSFGGTIHVPWQNNPAQNHFYYGAMESVSLRQFRLKKWDVGVETDVSPSNAGIEYGTNRGPFGVRTFDGEGGDGFVLLAAIGNDTESTGSGDKHAVFVSDDGSATWTLIEGPLADSGAPTNRPAFEAAFGGDSEQIIFIWGPPNYMKYSDDFGATLQDKSGNLSALSCPGFIGIAGGSS